MNDTKPKITVVGSGYVGMAMSALLSQICNVTVYDIDLKRVKLINQGISTVDEAEIHEFLNTIISELAYRIIEGNIPKLRHFFVI